MSCRPAALSILTCAFIFVFAVAAEEIKSVAKRPTSCPIMQGQTVKTNHCIDIPGKRIYANGKGCINQIKTKPDKYIKRLDDKGAGVQGAPKETIKTY